MTCNKASILTLDESLKTFVKFIGKLNGIVSPEHSPNMLRKLFFEIGFPITQPINRMFYCRLKILLLRYRLLIEIYFTESVQYRRE